jgi:hypothetical protein
MISAFRQAETQKRNVVWETWERAPPVLLFKSEVHQEVHRQHIFLFTLWKESTDSSFVSQNYSEINLWTYKLVIVFFNLTFFFCIIWMPSEFKSTVSNYINILIAKEFLNNIKKHWTQMFTFLHSDSIQTFIVSFNNLNHSFTILFSPKGLEVLQNCFL